MKAWWEMCVSENLKSQEGKNRNGVLYPSRLTEELEFKLFKGTNCVNFWSNVGAGY